MRGKTAEHHRVDRAQTRTSQHGKGRFGNHGHVDQDAVAFDNAQVFQNRRHALHFGVQVAECVRVFLVCFS